MKHVSISRLNSQTVPFPFGALVSLQVGDHVVQMSLMEIGPDVAKAWLENEHPNNRRTPSTTSKYATEMASGGWRWTPEPIVFSIDGKLINGGNRLRAVIESGVSIPATVWFDCPEDVFAAIDRGKTRSIWQADMMTGQVNPRILYQMSRSLLFLDTGKLIIPDSEIRRIARTLAPAWEACSGALTKITVNGRQGLRVGCNLAVCIAWLSDPDTALGFSEELLDVTDRRVVPGTVVRNFLRWYENTASGTGNAASRDSAYAASAALRTRVTKQETQFIRATREAWMFWRERQQVVNALELTSA